MAVSPDAIRQLLRPPDERLSDQRALDFVNSKFPSYDSLDYDQLEWLLRSKDAESSELATKLEASTKSRDEFVEQALATARSSLSTARELSLTRHTLVDQLSTLAEEVLPRPGSENETPLLELERLQAQLVELEEAREYAGVVLQVLELSDTAQADIPPVISPSSLSAYKALQTYVAALIAALPSSPRPTLSITARAIQRRAWNHIRDTLSSKLLAAAEKLRWPLAVDLRSLKRDDLQAFSKCFLDLLQLQNAGVILHASESVLPEEGPRDAGIYPLQALVRPIAQRFKFHFEGDRPTNRLDKPEWYFSHMLGVIRDTSPMIEAVFQPLLSTGGYKSINAKREFMRLVLPVVARHLILSVAHIISDPSLLAHTVYQTLEFDTAINEEGFSLDGTWQSGGQDAKEWEGLAGELLGDGQVFRAWLEGERKFTQAQYEEILGAFDAWVIADAPDMSGSGEDVLRVTNSSRRLQALVEQVTDRYAPLPSFSQRTSFLTSVQLPLLEAYHTRISSSLDAFEALSSSFVRAVPGALSGQVNASKDLTSGVEGTDRLLKGWVSAEGIIAAMDRWGEEIFFLELWSEINIRASLRSRAAATASLPDPKPTQESIVEGTLFDELIVQYRKLSKRAESMIVRHVTSEVESKLKEYFNSRWDIPISGDLGLPPSLVPGLTSLSSHLASLSHALPIHLLVTLYRQITPRISSHILSRAILHAGRGRYTPEAGATFSLECQAWLEVCASAVGSKVGRIERGWERLLEAGRIVGLGKVEYPPAVKVAWDGSTRDWEAFREALNLQVLSREEIKDVMKARIDCGR